MTILPEACEALGQLKISRFLDCPDLARSRHLLDDFALLTRRGVAKLSTETK